MEGFFLFLYHYFFLSSAICSPGTKNNYPLDQLLSLGKLSLIFISLNFFSFYAKDSSIKKILKATLVISLFMIVIEIIFFKQPVDKFVIFGLVLPRYAFVVGEVNYSGFFFFTLFLIACLQKHRLYSYCFLMLSLATFSRGIFVAGLIFFFLFFLKKTIPKSLEFLLPSFLVFFILYPFINILAAKYLPRDKSFYLSKLSTDRYFLHTVYSIEGIKRITGNGYMQSRKKIRENLENHKKEFPWIKIRKHNYVEHSLQVEVLSDFGLTGYLIFAFFLVKCFRIAWARSHIHGMAFISFLTMTSFLNVLSEWTFIFFMGYMISLSKECFNIHAFMNNK